MEGLMGTLMGISIATFDYQRVYHSRFVWLWNSTGKETPRFAREPLKVLQVAKLEEGSFVSTAQVILKYPKPEPKIPFGPYTLGPRTLNPKPKKRDHLQENQKKTWNAYTHILYLYFIFYIIYYILYIIY